MSETVATCRVSECDRPAKGARGMCWTHYDRWRAYGDPRATAPPVDPVEEMWSKIAWVDVGCWFYDSTNSRPPRLLRDGKQVPVRDLVYAIEVGPIPDNCRLVRLCAAPTCVRPDHHRVVARRRRAA